ncbi:MAG: phosphatidate cytidylyltransferase [Deinococcota bacterium]
MSVRRSLYQFVRRTSRRARLALTRSGLTPLQARVISSCVVFGFLLLVLYVGMPLMIPAYLLFTWLGLQEYTTMMNLRDIPIRKRSLFVAAALTFPASLPASYPGFVPLMSGMSWREALLGVFALYLIGLEIVRPNDNSVLSVVFSLMGYIYVPWFLGYAITLRYTPDGVLGLWYLTVPILVIIASDIGGYTFGRLFGKHQIAPQVSPNKTLEGSLGGLFLAVVTVLVMLFGLEFFLNLRLELYDAVLFGLLVGSAAQIGDLFESLIKRWVGVKDSGFLMPGHGGVLDRIDSFLIAVPITYYFVTLVALR